MYKIKFYQDEKGNEPVREYLEDLSKKSDKNSRINLNKIRDYMKILSEHGTRAGEPFVKHIDGDLWELRPLRTRIFFLGWNGEYFVLLHYFMKQSQRTPKREIETAKRLMNDFVERSKQE